MENNVSSYIEKFGLQPHPEGGYYTRTYQSEIILDSTTLPSTFNGYRILSTAIYYLLEHGNFSAFHRLKSDEGWHFYGGGPLSIFTINAACNLETIVLGNNIRNNEKPQHIIKAGTWFAATPCENSSFSFVGCTVAPGFDFKDLEFADRNKLISQYPHIKPIIEKLTR